MAQKTIAKNTVLMTVASVLQKIIAFVYFAIIARHFGAGDTGIYFFAMSFVTIFSVFIDLGLSNVLVREGAKKIESIEEYLSSIMFVKIFTSVLTYLLIIFFINILNYDFDTKILVYIAGITIIFDSIHLSFYGALRSIGNLFFESIGMFSSQLITMILGSLFIFLKLPLYFLMIAFLIPSFLNVIYSFIIIKIKYNIKLRFLYDREVIKYFFPIAIPFALAAIFNRVYSYIDSIILSKLASAEVVGWYSIPYKTSYAFQFLPIALVAAVYPRFSEYFFNNKERLKYIFENALKYLLILAFPIAVGIFILADDIVLNVFSEEYLNSVLPLKILIFATIFIFTNFLLGAFLNACDRQKTQTILVGIAMVVNIILNFSLIPKYGASGAAISALAGNIFITFVSFFIVPKIIQISFYLLFKTILKLVISSLIMALFVCYTKSVTNFYLAILVGAIVYPLMLFVTKTISRKQVFEAIKLIKN
jgi:O-antigen/teichoic acid export membrane protein